jgi:hypothetical protein
LRLGDRSTTFELCLPPDPSLIVVAGDLDPLFHGFGHGALDFDRGRFIDRGP